MAKWITCDNGSLLNVDNVLGLKVHKSKRSVQAECVGNITRDLFIGDTLKEAHDKMMEIAGLVTEKKAESATEKVKTKPAAKK